MHEFDTTSASVATVAATQENTEASADSSTDLAPGDGEAAVKESERTTANSKKAPAKVPTVAKPADKIERMRLKKQQQKARRKEKKAAREAAAASKK